MKENILKMSSSVCKIGIILLLINYVNFVSPDADAGAAKFRQEQQASRNYYPSDYNRYRRGFALREETPDFNSKFKSFKNTGGSSSPKESLGFGSFGRKGGGSRPSSRGGFQSRGGFPGFGGPDAFLAAATTEPPLEDDSFKGFGGSQSGFPSFGKNAWNSGRGKGGGLNHIAAGKAAPPATMNFGNGGNLAALSNNGFNFGGNAGGGAGFGVGGDRGGAAFNVGGGVGAAFGAGGGGNFGNPKNSFYGSFGASNPQGRNAFSSGGSSFSSRSNFGGSVPSGGDSNGFPSPIGDPFAQPGNSFKSENGYNPFPINNGNSGSSSNGKVFPNGVEDLSGGHILGPLKNFKDLGNIDLNALFRELEPKTTTKKPLRIIRPEESNKVFSGGSEDDNEKEEINFANFPSINFPKSEKDLMYSAFGRSNDALKLADCDENPPPPINGKVLCTRHSGCRVDCQPNYQMPGGQSRIYLTCQFGQWVIKGSENEVNIPDCEPVCDPPCLNAGICMSPSTCQCPDDFEGVLCEKPKVEEVTCRDKPPTPENTRIFCAKEECSARCIEGYEFDGGFTRVSYECEMGKWKITSKGIKSTPNCKPICDPPCLNGGICLTPDLCECTSDFRGPLCQYPISNCDPKKLDFNGGYNCTGEGINFGCKLWCPSGIDMKHSTVTNFFSCNYETSKWSPTPIPECDYSFLFSTETSAKLKEDQQVTYYEEVKPKSGTCFTWSGTHYKSFDGKVYSFESGCPYTLLQDSALGTFSVNLLPNDTCFGVKCKRSLKVFAEGDQYLLESSDHGQPVLSYHDSTLAIPGQMNGMVTERVAHFVVLKLAGIGLTLKWDLQSLVVAEVSELLWNRTAGLCGRHDGSPENDWGHNARGKADGSINTFLKSWKATTVGEPCTEPPVTKSSCSGAMVFQSRAFCSRLKDDPQFELCRTLIDVEPYIESCQWDFCSCKASLDADSSSCGCDSFAAFVRECTNIGGAVEGGWRSKELCPMKCELGLEYKSCMPAIQPRCGQAADTALPEFCVEGCDCAEGLVLNDEGVCVIPAECPCSYHNKTYTSGDTIPNDCNSCTCLSGEWVCTEVKCGSRCAAIGDPHYKTFDGRRYDFMGKCTYYLVKGDDFSIEAENIPCAGAISEAMNFPTSYLNQVPSCTKSVTIRVPGTTIHLKQDRELTVNAVEVTDLPIWANDVFIKKASNLFITVSLSNRVEIWWDGQTRVYIDAPADLRGSTSGLCGTFNDNQKDDFLTPEGDVESTPAAFANKWKISEKCDDVSLQDDPHPCDRHVQNREKAEKFCVKIKSKLFAKCHLEVDPESFYTDCIYDLCSCESKPADCLCPVLAAYGKECAAKGVLIDWRSNIRQCGMHCERGQKYQVCGDSCTRTCMDVATNPDCKRQCVEGCNCQTGFSLDANDVCVPVANCPCVYEGKEYKPGYEMFQATKDGDANACRCTRAQWECRLPTSVEMASPEFFTEPQVECRQPDEQYSDCMGLEEPTCLTMHLHPEPPSDVCRFGCRCKDGFTRSSDTGQCIRYGDCPCHHGGKSYSEGETIQEDCNTCTCEGGLWACTSEMCPGMCTAWGDSHYKTFDGRIFDFHGTCDYMLAKGKRSRVDTFEVSIQNVPCGTNGVTCAKSLTLRVGAGAKQEVVHFSRNKPVPDRNLTRIILRKAGVFVFAEVADLGLVLQWDKGTRAYITVTPEWKGKVKGLCGNYNEDSKDDFQTPSGGGGEVSAKIFGDSWKLQSYCPESIVIEDTCSIHPHRKVWATEKCAILKGDVFKPCHSEVPVEKYLQRCHFDSCGCDTGGDCHCLCTAVAAYAHECNIHGVPIRWRRDDFCAMQCDITCEHYEPCIQTCPKETCDSFTDPQPTLCRQDACVEGCAKNVCPPGQVLKGPEDKECVPKSQCEQKCLEEDGKVYFEGDVVSEDECHTCFCTRKKKVCKGTPCPTTITAPDVDLTTTKPSVSTDNITMTTTEKTSDTCRSGWSEWVNEDHPIFYKKNSDVEPIPDRLVEGSPSSGFCGKEMYADIKCRSVGDHKKPSARITCDLHEGLRCQRRKHSSLCSDFEISILCDCSEEVELEITTPSTPASPVTPPPVERPSTQPPTSVPDTCSQEGWTPWFNTSYPSRDGEYELLSNIRKQFDICPDHYVKDVECRHFGKTPKGSRGLAKCSNKGASCRNNGGQSYCLDYEIRVNCECKCQDGLGMEDGRIPADAITASSSLRHYDPENGRLNSEGGWSPIIRRGADIAEEWIQVDLGTKKEVTGVITQGNTRMRVFVSLFAVQVSETGAEWDEIRDEGENYAKQFTGNRDASTPVRNLFPKPVYVRYVRIIPLENGKVYNPRPGMRFEITGCDHKEDPSGIPIVFPGSTPPPTSKPIRLEKTPMPEICQDGWTPWMNSHVPSPENWDDIESYSSLRMSYSFCSESFIRKTSCRLSTLATPIDVADFNQIQCNTNIGLQCVNELQGNKNCYDYEIRFLCDCSETTTAVYDPRSTTEDDDEEWLPSLSTTTEYLDFNYSGKFCDITVPNHPHETDCQKFYECQPSTNGYIRVDKSCGPGTWYNPNTYVCDWPYVVLEIKPECAEPIITTVPPVRTVGADLITPPCTDHEWTEWFNISHPSSEEGSDYETFAKIRENNLEICDDKFIIDIECQYEEWISVSSPRGKGGSKGGRKGRPKGRPVLDRYVSKFRSYKESSDLSVTCDTRKGLVCDRDNRRRRNCQDYAIRVQCSCESRKPTTVFTLPPDVELFTPSSTSEHPTFTNYTDMRSFIPTTSPRMYNDYWCPPGRYYDEFAIRCSRICIYYRQFLVKTGRCLEDDEVAPACVDEVTGTACPPGFFLRDNSTCVSISNCNCMLPNGVSAPPERVFLVSDCEICKCSENQLICDNSKCFGKPQEFFCDEWSPWMSVSSPAGEGDDETLEALRKSHPDVCEKPALIECRDRYSGEYAEDLGQNLQCNVDTGLFCLNWRNPGGCKDYEVRIYCACEDIHQVTTDVTSKSPAFTIPPIRETLPPLPGCVKPFWSPWFNTSHPDEADGDYEVIDDILLQNEDDTCPKAYVEEVECSFFDEVTSAPRHAKGKRRFSKGKRPMRLTTLQRKDASESRDMYVTCNRLTGLACSNDLQPGRRRCNDYAIRVMCNCDPMEFLPPDYTDVSDLSTTTIVTTTPYPGWPIVGPDCDEGKIRVECGIKCKNVCMFYLHYLELAGNCISPDDCAPVCMEQTASEACAPGFYQQNNSTCVFLQECTCRLPSGEPLKAGARVQVSKCESCECLNNELLCSTEPDCISTEAPIKEITIATQEVTQEQTTTQTTTSTTTMRTTIPALSLIKIRCDDWSPWMNMRRTPEGDFQRMTDLREQFEDLCEKPVNVSCRDASAKLPAEQLGQVLICSPEEGLICRNDQNKDPCFDYEVSFYCECEEGETPSPELTEKPTKAPIVSTTLAPCAAWSPWINEHRPWLEDGDTELKNLDDLRNDMGFCTEGEISEIECLDSASDHDITVNRNVRCDRRYGLRCLNKDQPSGICFDFKIRYYCSCETSPATRPTIIVPSTPTPPSVCAKERYLNLLELVEDSAFSAPSSLGSSFSPSNARISRHAPSGSYWSPRKSKLGQYLQVDLGDPQLVYGLVIGGNPKNNERVTSFNVQTSDNLNEWSNLDELFQGPLDGADEKTVIYKNPVETRYVKILPLSWHGKIALRVEVIGCSHPTSRPLPSTQKIPICEEEMGIENGSLKDGQISVSSVLNDMFLFYGKQGARLNSRKIPRTSAGAWVAKPSKKEYIRFDFLEPSKISGVVTQGRDRYKSWVESYAIAYSPDAVIWSTIKDPNTGDDKVFSANFDSSTQVSNTFDRLLETRFLELRPLTWHDNIALRVEIIGCFHPYPEVSTTPLPSTIAPPPPNCHACPTLPTEFYDECYACGPGQLFDGKKCTPDVLCPCYVDGRRYALGTPYETQKCEKCTCAGEGKSECTKIQCEPCEKEDERPILTSSCSCMCKPCEDGTKLCPGSGLCLDENKWCDGIEHCGDDETDCPGGPEPECPVPNCPNEWTLNLELEGDAHTCPKYVCSPPDITTPMNCPPPLCPFSFNIVMVPKKRGEACPKYECIPPVTTMEIYTCPPPSCPDGYEIEMSQSSNDEWGQQYGGGQYDQYSQYDQYDDKSIGCDQYKCVTNEPPTAPCPPPTCPNGYDVSYASSKEMIELCPLYSCIPIVTTTPCPPVSCPNGLQVMYIKSSADECPKFTCIRITTPSLITTTIAPKCPEVALPVCSIGEELYHSNPETPCPIFKCKPIGVPPPTSAAPKVITPTCTIDGRDLSTFDGTDFSLDACGHVLAKDKVDDKWQISIHRNCSAEASCNRYLEIEQEDQKLVMNPDLMIVWNDHKYSAAQAHKIGSTSKTFSISKVGDTVHFRSETFKYDVFWDVLMSVKIELDNSVIYQVEGLCGFYTGSSMDDLSKPDGSVSNSIKDFGNSWLVGKPCEVSTLKCSQVDSTKAFILCNAIDSPPFTECHELLPPATFLKGCVDSLCGCLNSNRTEEDCKCNLLQSYVTACLKKKPNARLAEWRIVTKCYKECPDGEVYRDCFKYSCEESCDTLKDPDSCQESEGNCISGCFCAPGLVRMGSRCVPKERCRDCVCEGYGDPHYKSFDRSNFTFNGECQYVAARDRSPIQQHTFQVLVKNKRCQRHPITMCTESVKVLFNDHSVSMGVLPTNQLVTTVDEALQEVFPNKIDWASMEKPDDDHITLVIPEIELEVSYSKDNYGFTIRLPSHLFRGKLEGLCGNCNFDTDDDFTTMDGTLATSVEEFGKSFLLDDPISCQILEKEREFCVPPHPDKDQCLKLMDPNIFGECHPLEDPVAYISSCQLDLCLAHDLDIASCQSLEAYARRCSQLGVCLNWRSEDLCPKDCPEGLQYMSCGFGCVKTCDNYEKLNQNPESCLMSNTDGCFCPEGMALDGGICIPTSRCVECDTEGHRVGESWRKDNCTSCECTEDAAVICSTESCPSYPVCAEGYELQETPNSGSDCCGPTSVCILVKPKDCPPLQDSEEACGYGKKKKLIEVPGKCPQEACVCLEPDECPEFSEPSNEDLKPGESWNLDDKGCCARYVRKCTEECPESDCPEFYQAEEKALEKGDCCPEYKCVPPNDTCIYEPQSVVENGFERPLHEFETVDKVLYKVGETWVEGLCIECSCTASTLESKPAQAKCLRKTCPSITDSPDRNEYLLEEVPTPGSCCPQFVRKACIDDGEQFEAEGTLYDSLNGCRSVECKRNQQGDLEKVEQYFSCDEQCRLGWEYVPSPLAPQVCCGGCEQVACDADGELKQVGDEWTSTDHCTEYHCVKSDSTGKIQTRSKEIQCNEPTEEELKMYKYKETKIPGQCCSVYTRVSCVFKDEELKVGSEVVDPDDNCFRYTCELTADGNVTRREKEQACITECPLGQIYVTPGGESNECCGKCLQTQCVADGVMHPVGENWENPDDVCFLYSCQIRDEVLTTVAIKRDCPFFDPDCPRDKIISDQCCKICNVTRETKKECQPEGIDPRDTINMFVLEAKPVGKCTNPRPVRGFNRCSGQCDSRTVFKLKSRGISAEHVSQCDCCRPTKFAQIRVNLKCNRGYSFDRVFDNIEACECQPCQGAQQNQQYSNDEPIPDEEEFKIPPEDLKKIEDQEKIKLGYKEEPTTKKVP